MTQREPMNPHRAPASGPILPLWKVLLPPLLILCAAAALALFSLAASERAARTAFEHKAQRIQQRITERVQDYGRLLHSGVGLLNNAPKPGRAQWRAFVEDLKYARSYPGSQGFGFSPHVPKAALAEHLRERRTEYPDYAVHSPGQRADYCPVVYLEPLDQRNQRAIGFDLYSEPVRRACLDRARDTGEVSLTGKVQLVQEAPDDPHPGCLLYAPVYRQGSATGSVAERRAALRGFVSCPLRMPDLLASILEPQDEHLGIALYDGPKTTAEARLFEAPLSGSYFSQRAELELFGRQWTLVVSAAQESLFASDRREALVLLFLGGLLAGAVYLMVRNIDASRAQAGQRVLYQAMFEDNRSVCLLVAVQDGTIRDANHAAVLFYGYTRQEMQGLPVGRINTLPPDRLSEALASAGSQGGEYTFEHRLKDGTLRHVQVHSGPFDSGGEALLLSTVQDITDRVQAEAALSESRERFQALVESMDQGVALSGLDDLLTYVNPAFARMAGQGAEALVGRSIGSLLPEDEASAHAERMALRRQGSREAYETRVLRPDGAALLLRVVPFPFFGPGGQYQGSCGLVSDITEKRAAREAERQRQVRRLALLRLHEMQQASRQELLDFALEQALKLTGSEVGYICGYDDATRQFSLQAWSAGVMEQCAVPGPQQIYNLDQTGVWGDAVRLRQPLLLNDFNAAHTGKRGLPEGHLLLRRYLTVPVIMAGRACAVVGVANKPGQYTEEDVAQLQLFMDGLWGILERQAAEQELREVTERFHLAVRAGRIGLWDWDLKTGATHCDPAMEQLFGLDDNNRTGTAEDWLCRVHPEDREAVRRALERAAGEGGRFEASFCVRRPDGSVAHIEASALCHLDTQGQPLRLVGVNIDVTRLREAEQKLLHSHRFLQTIIDALPHTFFCKDAAGRYLMVNKTLAELRGGADTEAFLGRGVEDFDPPLLAAQHLAADQSILAAEPGATISYEYELQLPGGGVQHRMVFKSLVRLPDESLGIVGINLDNTQRKAAEEELAQSHRFRQTLIDTLPIPFVAKDSQGRYLMANQTFARLYGLTQADILGRTMPEFGPTPVGEAHYARDIELLGMPDGQSLQYELDYAPPGDTLRRWLVLKSHLPLPDGERGIASMALDISDRMATEEALREERRRLADVIEGTNAGTWEWDVTTDVLFCNRRWAEILGFGPQEPAPRSVEQWRRLVHPEDITGMDAAFERHTAGATPFFDSEYRVRHKDGQWVWVHSRGRVFRFDADGSPLCMSGTMSDITVRKAAEEQLALVARFPVENPHPVLRADSAGALLYVNPAAEPLLLGWGQGMNGSLPRELCQEVRLALESGQARVSERSYASGIYSFTVSPFVDKGYANIYAVEVTQRKAAELALRQSEGRYRELAVMLRLMCDNVPDMIWAKDMDSRYLFANKAMCEQYMGVTDTQLPIGKTDRYFYDRQQALCPGNLEWHTVGNTCHAGDQAVLQDGGSARYERCGHFSGRYECFDVRKGAFVNDQGVVIGTVGSARNITERKQAEEALARSEERFRTLAQVSPVGIFQADTRGRCLYVNDQWARISGYPKETALGLGWLRTLGRAERRTVMEGFREIVRTGKDFVSEFRFRNPADSGRWVLVRAAVERDAQGRRVGIVGALTDITELKRAEEALRRAKTQAEAATRAKAQFLANMSHEIRTPLAGVIGTTRILAQTRLDEEQARLAEMAVESGGALLNVVNDILDFSKLEAGQMSLRLAPFALRRFLESVAGPSQVLARERNLSFTLEVAPEVPDDLVGDEVRLGQVLRNLLSNARKFTETGGITLSVGQLFRTADQVRLRLSVSDTGAGIEPDYLPRLFESFSQADSSYGKQHGGTGLGLAICKSLVEQMNGSIQVYSTLGQGSTFTVLLPLALASPAQDMASRAAAPEPAPPPTAQPGRGPAPLRVLLAEDNAIGRILMEHLLTNAGHQVHSVGHGQAVLDALRQDHFDLVLMDVQMPHMDGITATRRLRQGACGEERAGIAVVALTAYASREDRRQFLEAGMDDAVSKPAEEGPLFAAMERALRKAQNRSLDEAAAQSCAPAPQPLPPRLDAEYLERSFGQYADLLAAMLRQFEDHTLAELLQEMALALETGDLRRGKIVSHKARGALGSLGAALGAFLAAQVENAADTGAVQRFGEAGQALLDELSALAEHLRQGLPWAPTEKP